MGRLRPPPPQKATLPQKADPFPQQSDPPSQKADPPPLLEGRPLSEGRLSQKADLPTLPLKES